MVYPATITFSCIYCLYAKFYMKSPFATGWGLGMLTFASSETIWTLVTR